MGVRAYGRETLASLPIDVDKNWNDRSISNVNSLQANEHITVTARGANRKLYPALNRYDSETDGWHISKDNNDIERKFFKDDCTQDNSGQYTMISGTFPIVDTDHYVFDATKEFRTTVAPPQIEGVYRIAVQFVGDNVRREVYIKPGEDSQLVVRKTAANDYELALNLMGVGMWTKRQSSGHFTWDTVNPNTVELIVTTTMVYVYLNGVSKGYARLADYPIETTAKFQIRGNGTVAAPTELYEIAYLPPESYADDFTTDTSVRYQPVLGTVAYDDTNKRMTVTTATGANGKASGRLKSYKFCEGSQIYDVLLPTGADGDFICMVTHATDPAMTNGIGVGLQSDGAGNWNLATLSGTTVTEGADSGLVDGKTARIEIEKDITGAYWYYIYDASGTKPTTATGKLFTTLTEGYTGWYANGNSKAYAIENISIRAESIVGRTNVEVTEPFWFKEGVFQNESGTANIMRIYPSTLNEETITATMKFPPYSGTPQRVYVLCGWQNTALVLDPTAANTTSNGYVFKILRNEGTNQAYLHKMVNGVLSTLFYTTISIKDNTDHEIQIVRTSLGQISVYKDGIQIGTTVTDTTYARGHAGVAIWNNTKTEITTINNLQISGTRVYNKPIHRGAMLETYHDGTQEVVGTTFIDDFNWDRSEEYTVSKTGTAPDPVFDTVNGCLRISNLPEQSKVGVTKVVSKGLSLATGFIYARVKCVTENMSGFSISAASTELFLLSSYSLRAFNTDITDSGGSFPDILYTTGDIIEYFISYDLGSNSIGITIYKNGEFIWSAKKTITHTLSKSPVGFRLHDYSIGTDKIVEVQEFVAIAVDSDATNGIAAYIPPIGGGARYGEQEKVYKQLVNAAKFGEYKTTALAKTTNAGAEAIEMYFKNITDTTNIATDDTDTLAISLSDTNYATSTKDLQLLHRDRGDTIEVAVRKTAAATEVSPACYVTDLMILPKVEG
jgi:hypothetical protein